MDKSLPSNVISIHRTRDQIELAEIYTAVGVFVNPTREEVLGLTNLKANACGVPVITFDTAGSPKCINTSSGIVVELNDIQTLKDKVIDICDRYTYSIEACCNRSKQFDKNKKYLEYIELYEAININGN